MQAAPVVAAVWSAQERVVAAGGTVLNNSGLRVMGVLQCTRAIGDRDLQPYGVIPLPDVLSLLRTGQEEFLVLATDGLWDVLSNEVSMNVMAGNDLHACMLPTHTQSLSSTHTLLLLFGACGGGLVGSSPQHQLGAQGTDKSACSVYSNRAAVQLAGVTQHQQQCC